MPLPSFTVTGTLFDILGDTASSALVATGAASTTITFTPNIALSQQILWSGDLYRVRPVTGIITGTGITRAGNPVKLLANDAGLNVTGIQWTVKLSTPGLPASHAFTFTAPADGATVNLSTVATTASLPVQTLTSITASQISDSTAIGRSLITAADQAAVQAIVGASGGGTSTSSVPLRSLFQPMGEIISSAVLISDTIRTSLAGDYTSSTVTRWDNAVFNYQGQSMIANGGDATTGGLNDSTGRVESGAPFTSCIDVEFVHTGDKLDFKFTSPGSFDCSVYIEDSGVMKKAQYLPTGGSPVGTTYRSLRFSEPGTRRIRLILPGAVPFLGVVTEASALLRKSPDRPLAIITGDSYVDAANGYVSSAIRTTFTNGIVDHFIEMTGFAVARCGQGGTGHFNDGNSGTSTTPVGSRGTTPYFSTARKAKYTTYLAQKPVLFLINGSYNDGGLSGGSSGMQTRLTSELDWITTTDPYVSIASVGPQPLASSYIPTTAHTLNRTGMLAAVAAKTMANGAGVAYVDANNPTTPFWTGNGSEAAPDGSPPSLLIGLDSLHPNWYGAKHYARSILSEIANMRVSAARAGGIA